MCGFVLSVFGFIFIVEHPAQQPPTQTVLDMIIVFLPMLVGLALDAAATDWNGLRFPETVSSDILGLLAQQPSSHRIMFFAITMFLLPMWCVYVSGRAQHPSIRI